MIFKEEYILLQDTTLELWSQACLSAMLLFPPFSGGRV